MKDTQHAIVHSHFMEGLTQTTVYMNGVNLHNGTHKLAYAQCMTLERALNFKI